MLCEVGHRVEDLTFKGLDSLGYLLTFQSFRFFTEIEHK